uniref:Uncharacterized protein n=1 Tax=Salix viminalis TaxID=40686 RepID=A0A6N2N4L0_SALVM
MNPSASYILENYFAFYFLEIETRTVKNQNQVMVPSKKSANKSGVTFPDTARNTSMILDSGIEQSY